MPRTPSTARRPRPSPTPTHPPTPRSESLAELTERVRTAVALPVRIELRDAYDACATELTVTADIDSGGRGRPRVTFDVTQGLSAAGVGVFMADGARRGAAGGRAGRGAAARGVLGDGGGGRAPRAGGRRSAGRRERGAPVCGCARATHPPTRCRSPHPTPKRSLH